MGFSLPADAELALRLSVFLGFFVALACWEWARPARTLILGRGRRWGANLGLAMINILLIRIALPGSALAFADFASSEGWGLLNAVALPEWIGVFVAIVLLDLVIYFQHVLFHSVPVLTRLHSVHHADPDFD